MEKTITVPPSLPGLVKPTVDTPFHIDYGWWERQGLRIGLEYLAHLCAEHRSAYGEHHETEKIDWIDERTGEVTRVDGPQHVLRIHCSKQPDYIHDGLPLVAAVLRVFLANGNAPLTCRDLATILGRSAQGILRTMSGRRIYKGIRPARRAGYSR